MSSHTVDNTHGEVHVHGGPRIYLQILIALVILTCLTVFVARHPFENNAANVSIALAIATLKASLVGLIFMHLKYDSKVNAVIIIAAFVFLGIFLSSTLTDITTRDAHLPSDYGTTGGAVGGYSPELSKPEGGAKPPEKTPSPVPAK